MGATPPAAAEYPGQKKWSRRIRRRWAEDWDEKITEDSHYGHKAFWHWAKVRSQQAIGLVGLLFLLYRVYLAITTDLALTAELILATAAAVLAGSTAIELIHTLFTPGPDEAIKPLLTGLASAALYTAASVGSPPSVSEGIGVLTLVASVGLAFEIARRNKDELDRRPDASAKAAEVRTSDAQG